MATVIFDNVVLLLSLKMIIFYIISLINIVSVAVMNAMVPGTLTGPSTSFFMLHIKI